MKHTGQAWGGACELTVLRSDPLGETVVANCLSEPLASVAQERSKARKTAATGSYASLSRPSAQCRVLFIAERWRVRCTVKPPTAIPLVARVRHTLICTTGTGIVRGGQAGWPPHGHWVTGIVRNHELPYMSAPWTTAVRRAVVQANSWSWAFSVT